jgi:cytosine/uracil/thiamine/allantoin permease
MDKTYEQNCYSLSFKDPKIEEEYIKYTTEGKLSFAWLTSIEIFSCYFIVFGLQIFKLYHVTYSYREFIMVNSLFTLTVAFNFTIWYLTKKNKILAVHSGLLT